jgi:hypothetical protein
MHYYTFTIHYTIDFQYRHAIYVIDRVLEVYRSFDLYTSAVLLKDTLRQKAAMHARQGETSKARVCYEVKLTAFSTYTTYGSAIMHYIVHII